MLLLVKLLQLKGQLRVLLVPAGRKDQPHTAVGEGHLTAGGRYVGRLRFHPRHQQADPFALRLGVVARHADGEAQLAGAMRAHHAQPRRGSPGLARGQRAQWQPRPGRRLDPFDARFLGQVEQDVLHRLGAVVRNEDGQRRLVVQRQRPGRCVDGQNQAFAGRGGAQQGRFNDRGRGRVILSRNE